MGGKAGCGRYVRRRAAGTAAGKKREHGQGGCLCGGREEGMKKRVHFSTLFFIGKGFLKGGGSLREGAEDVGGGVADAPLLQAVAVREEQAFVVEGDHRPVGKPEA